MGKYNNPQLLGRKPRSKETKWLSVVTEHIMALGSVFDCLMSCCLISSPALSQLFVSPKPHHPNPCLPQIHKHSGLAASIGFLPLLYKATQAMLLSFQQKPQPGLCSTAWALLCCWAHARGDFPGYFLTCSSATAPVIFLLMHWLCTAWVVVTFMSCQ